MRQRSADAPWTSRTAGGGVFTAETPRHGEWLLGCTGLWRLVALTFPCFDCSILADICEWSFAIVRNLASIGSRRLPKHGPAARPISAPLRLCGEPRLPASKDKKSRNHGEPFAAFPRLMSKRVETRLFKPAHSMVMTMRFCCSCKSNFGSGNFAGWSVNSSGTPILRL